MTKTIEHAIVDNLGKMKTVRSLHDNTYQDITDFVMPNRGDFQRTTVRGERRDRRIFNDTAVQANITLASVLNGGLTDPSDAWFNFEPKDMNLKDNHEFIVWKEEVVKRMFSVMKSSDASFYQQNHQFFLDLVAFGTAVMWIEEDTENVASFQTRHLGECWIEENKNGIVDTVYREFKYTARQAAQDFGEENLPKNIQDCLKKDPHEKFEFVHAVMPSVDYIRSGGTMPKGQKRRPFVSIYVEKQTPTILSIRGFNEMPYVVARWEKLSGEVYGRSPAWNVMSTIKMINLMEEVDIRAAQKQVDPPMLLSDDGVVMPMQTFPGGVNIGGLNDDGKELMKPMTIATNLNVSDSRIERKAQEIKEAYFVDQFMERQGIQPLTATEVRDNQEQRLRLVGPQTKRVETEYLNRLINRLFGIMQRRKLLPDIPVGVLQELGNELDLEVVYTSPLSFTQRSNKLLSVQRYFAAAAPLFQINPELTETLDLDAINRKLALASGVEAEDIKSKEEVELVRQQREQQVQQQQQFQNVVEGAGAVADLQKAGINVIPE